MILLIKQLKYINYNIVNIIQQLKLQIIMLQLQISIMLKETKQTNPQDWGQCTGPSKMQQLRQKLQWNIVENRQVQLNQKYVLYELIESQEHFDLYRGMSIKSKSKVIVRVTDKSAIRRSLETNQCIGNWQDEYSQAVQKLEMQTLAQIRLYNRHSNLFMIQCEEVYQNNQIQIKICEDYYGQSVQKMLKKRGSVSVSQALAILKQLLLSLSQLHKQGMILTELNPSFVVHKNGVYKLCDFSSMRKVSHKFQSTLNFYYSYSYEERIAPQLSVCPEVVDMKSEVWALGVFFYHLIAHNLSYEERADDIVRQAKSHHLMFQTKTGQASQEVVQFLRQLIATDPDQRITWKKLVNHPIFQNQQYSYAVKITPLIDPRCSTLKNKQTDLIPQQILNITNQIQMLKNAKMKQITFQINNKGLFRKLKPQDAIKPQIHLNAEDQTFFHVKNVNLMVLKANYIYYQIIDKLTRYSLIDPKRRSHVETVYLIAQRCFNYMKKLKGLQRNMNDRRIQNYLQQSKNLQHKIKQVYQQYQKNLKKMQSSTYYMSNDILGSMLRKDKCKQKGRILKGKQGLDFTLSQHVQFTQHKYINKILCQLKGENMILEYVKINMMYYQEINNISLEDIQVCSTFQEVVSAKINNYSR